jgi:hypothetical protein
MSEAPPEAGGFWHLSSGKDSQGQDDLRTQLLTLLEERGLTRHSGSDEFRELRSFMESGLFLIQTLKWPLGTTFNHLSKSNQTRVIEHAVNAHLRQEILTIAPAGVLAMGSAALAACRLLSKDSTGIPAGGVDQLRRTNGTFTISFAGQDIPLDVTLLPVGQNIRLPNRAKIIREDLASFLSRRGWSPQGSSWKGSPPRGHPLRWT